MTAAPDPGASVPLLGSLAAKTALLFEAAIAFDAPRNGNSQRATIAIRILKRPAPTLVSAATSRPLDLSASPHATFEAFERRCGLTDDRTNLGALQGLRQWRRDCDAIKRKSKEKETRRQAGPLTHNASDALNARLKRSQFDRNHFG
jgi:hypothetical protein